MLKQNSLSLRLKPTSLTYIFLAGKRTMENLIFANWLLAVKCKIHLEMSVDHVIYKERPGVGG